MTPSASTPRTNVCCAVRSSAGRAVPDGASDEEASACCGGDWEENVRDGCPSRAAAGECAGYKSAFLWEAASGAPTKLHSCRQLPWLRACRAPNTRAGRALVGMLWFSGRSQTNPSRSRETLSSKGSFYLCKSHVFLSCVALCAICYLLYGKNPRRCCCDCEGREDWPGADEPQTAVAPRESQDVGAHSYRPLWSHGASAVALPHVEVCMHPV